MGSGVLGSIKQVIGYFVIWLQMLGISGSARALLRCWTALDKDRTTDAKTNRGSRNKEALSIEFKSVTTRKSYLYKTHVTMVLVSTVKKSDVLRGGRKLRSRFGLQRPGLFSLHTHI